MSSRSFSGFRLSLRVKLLLVALCLLIIPWIGTRYVQEIESYLRTQLEDALLTRTQMVATVMQSRPELFQTQTAAPLPTQGIQHIFVRPLRSPIQLDGYFDDWLPYQDRAQTFQLRSAIKGSEQSALAFKHRLGNYRKYLYATFEVQDNHVIYRKPNAPELDKNDHLIICLENPQGKLKQYIIATLAPGWVSAHEVDLAYTPASVLRPATRIKGEWQETATGYNIEIRIPLNMLGNKLSFAIADVDNPQKRETDTIVATAGIYQLNELGTIMFPSLEAETMLSSLQTPLMRTWVIDQHNRVIARTGSLTQDDADLDEPVPEQNFWSGLVTLFYKTILKQPATEFHDELLNASRLNSKEFRQALLGQSDIRWRQTPDKEVNILTAAYPVFDGEKVIGAVAIEQTSNAILLAQNRALEILFNLSALAFIIASVILLAFASRLSMRIRRLRDATHEAITADGRVAGTIQISDARDEIGDLSRDVADMLERLAQYNRYLETIASKLSHELRTPITVVRSSLDNLHPESDKQDITTYTQRAREGIERLNNILVRMSEATRLEQTMQNEVRQAFNLATVVAGCIAGYRLAHPQQHFNYYANSDKQAMIHGSPDLFAQMLDKLIDNAIDFALSDTPIEIQLSTTPQQVSLSIINQGPLLPEQMQANLFESMVSVRDKKGTQPHLGLGLYIAADY